jgi:iron complex outermembrane recepter protein
MQAPDTVTLPSLVVRVLLSPMPQEDTPLSVSVLGREELTRGKTGAFLEEAFQAVPGLQVQNRFNYAVGERILLRGSGARAQFGMRAIRILVDGVPASLPDGQSSLDHLDLPSLGRAELLRGPASSLYGNGAGAVLRMETRPPAAAPVRQEAQAVGGTQGLRELSSVTSGTLAGTGYLLSLGALAYDGFRDDPQEVGGSYGAARRWTANGQGQRALAGGTLVATVNLLDLDAENPGALPRSLLSEGSREAASFNVRQQTGKELTQAQAGVSWRGPIRRAEAMVAAWGIRRHVWNPIPPAIVDLDRGTGGIRGELQGERGWGPARVRWAAGVEVEAQWDHRRSYDNLQGSAGPLRLDQKEDVLGGGLFAQGILELAGGARFLTGTRFHSVRFHVRDRFDLDGDPDDSGSRTMEAVSPTAGLTIPLLPWLSARGSLSTVFQTPTTSELANRPSGAGGFNPSLEPQRGTTVEAGVRGRSGGGFGAEATAFQSRFTGELVPFEVPGAPGRVYFRNAGRSTHRGVEATSFLPLPGGFRGRAAYTFIDARFRHFVVEGEDLGGKRIPGIPRHRVEGVVSWQGKGREGSAGAFAEVRTLYQAKVPADDRNSDAAGAYALLDLRGGLGDARIRGKVLSPFAGVSNLLDRRYTAAVAVNAIGGRYFEPGPGRAFYLGLRAVWERD